MKPQGLFTFIFTVLISVSSTQGASDAELESFRKRLNPLNTSHESSLLFAEALSSGDEDLLRACLASGGCKASYTRFLTSGPSTAQKNKLALILLRTDEAWGDRAAEHNASYRYTVITAVQSALKDSMPEGEIDTFDLTKKVDRPRLADRVEALSREKANIQSKHSAVVDGQFGDQRSSTAAVAGQGSGSPPATGIVDAKVVWWLLGVFAALVVAGVLLATSRKRGG